ncbi:hypothetical protein CPB83DRAFT_853505 [Crepidotus variabilis]|uniref:F-box domain-containing protein n=1 Tax=Crepidotus variabilis TaxID=179855 RepID=A0A9P6EHH5_9AGAR|nr:hypothetical protein CPB83DRAFT_853505 [Crepidotus variabilis]
MFNTSLSEFLKRFRPKTKRSRQEEAHQIPLREIFPQFPKAKFPNNTFPNEIWLHIIDFMPPSQVQRLHTVNATFLHFVMDNKYRQMCFAYLDHRMVRNLARLMDPVVAKLVRVLHIYPDCLMEVLQDQTIWTVPTQGDGPNVTTKSKAALFRLFKANSNGALVQAILQVLGCLPNISKCNISWYCSPNGFSRFEPLLYGVGTSLAPFLTSLGASSTLRQLSLNLGMENMKLFINPKVFEVLRLEELDITLHHASWTDSLAKELGLAINSLQPTLRILTFQTFSRFAAELERFFVTLETLPVIEELRVSIPLEPPHLGDPEAFRSFLKKQRRTLATLRIKSNRTTGSEVDTIPEMFEESFALWVKNVLGGPLQDASRAASDPEPIPPLRLPALLNLEITSSHFPKRVALVCLQHFHYFGTPGLESVSITGADRTYQDVIDIMNAITQPPSPPHESSTQQLDVQITRPQPHSLRIGLVNLCPQLIDLLACSLPHLRRLGLVVKYVQPDVEEWSETHVTAMRRSPSNTEILAAAQLGKFLELFVETKSYPDWPLQCLSILATSMPSRITNEPTLQAAFLHVIPQLRVIC